MLPNITDLFETNILSNNLIVSVTGAVQVKRTTKEYFNENPNKKQK